MEIDSLYHGAGWTPRANFVAEVEAFSDGPEWVIEWQYRAVRRLLVERADTLVWLDYSSWLQMTRLVGRTMRRRLARQELWNGNYETSSRTRSISFARECGPSLEQEYPGATAQP